ncbi:DUF3325 domain-containing protein [Tardiphaga sp. 42S5]|uniref:DUF3325 domain-containing protein n=1 Tax=Tardiphaga sp. 42S5 TaxID=1404799 RepID=UPI0039C92831
MKSIFEAIMLLIVLGSTYFGFALLALSQSHHWRKVTRTDSFSHLAVSIFRTFGYCFLCFGLATAVVRDGVSFGAVLWLTIISVSAVLVAVTLTWRPSLLRGLAHLLAFTSEINQESR